jgi:hypothetical protein
MRLGSRCFSFPAIQLFVLLSLSSVALAQTGLGNGSLVADDNSPIVIRSDDAVQAPATRSAVKVSEGPWGKLESFPIFLEAPSYLVDRFPLPSSKPRWVLPGSVGDNLAAFFEEHGMTAADASFLGASTETVREGGLIYVFPSIAIVERLTPSSRSSLYQVLRKIPQNEYHVDPVLITEGTVETWFATAELRPELVDVIRRTSYERGETMAFSDLPLLMSYANGETECKTVMKALTRTRSLIVKMVLDATANVPEIMKYWTTGLNLRRKDVEPMLYSVIETQGAEKLDILHLLPAMPRKYVMTYPDFSLGLEGIYPDCHWTSLNFFNYTVEPYLLDSRLATTAVLERFNPVEPPYRFGDILFFLDAATGDAFHSCVYIADDIVFTKNGRNLLSPWIFTHVSDVRKVYLFDGNGRVQGFRNKNAPTSATEPKSQLEQLEQ